MITAYFVSNKASIIPKILEERKIAKLVNVSSSLSKNVATLDTIIDIDKFIYIYYDDGIDNIGLKSDLSRLKTIIKSAFFTTKSILFILVKPTGDTKKYVESSLKDAPIDKDKIEIIEHDRELMVPDVVKYIAGETFGDTTKNSYINVYIQEANKQEKERFSSTGKEILSNLTPVLADEYNMYKNRVKSISLEMDRLITEKEPFAPIEKEIPVANKMTLNQMETLLITGDVYTNFQEVAYGISAYFESNGIRNIIIDFTNSRNAIVNGRQVNQINVKTLRKTFIPENITTYLPMHIQDYASYISSELNVLSVNKKIIVITEDMYNSMTRIVSCSLDILTKVYIVHKSIRSFENLTTKNLKPDLIIIDAALMDEDFDISKYKNSFSGSRCLLKPENLNTFTVQESFYEQCFRA